jgi:hypothetical protein
MRVKKRGLSILFVLLFLMSAVPMAYAAPIGIMPAWANVNSISLSLQFSSNTASCTGSVIGNPGTTKITATFYLERKNANGTFTVVKEWPNQTSNSSILTFSGTHPVISGVTYRLRCDAVVTRNGINEPVSVTSGEKKCP